MSGSRHHQRTPAGPPRKLVAGLIILAVGCVAAAAFAVFAPKRTARLPPTSQEASVSPDQTPSPALADSQEQPFLPRFPVSLAAAPERPVTTAAGVDNDTTKTASAIPVTSKPLPTGERTTDEPQIPDVMTAREFTTLSRALASDDYLAVHIALNDFTTMPDACEPLIRSLTKAWTERHGILATALGSLKSPLNIRDPLSPQPAKILAANREGLTLAMGAGSHQVPWTTWSRNEIARMWSALAEIQGYREESAMIAILANWLTEDLVTARVLARKIDQVRSTAANDDSSMTALAWSVERWLAISWWEAGYQAHHQGDHDLAGQMAKRLKLVERMNNPRIDAETAATVFGLPSPDQPTTVPQATTAIAARSAPADALLALPGFPGVMSSGKWSVVPTGARCVGDGSLVLGDLGNSSRLEITFTPRRFQGTMLMILKPYEWLIDFDQSTIAMKGPRGYSSPVPVTLFPRHPNVVRVLFKDKEKDGSLAINRDPSFAEFTLRQPPDHLRLMIPPGGDVVINAITHVP